jgi:hypothetical protein
MTASRRLTEWARRVIAERRRAAPARLLESLTEEQEKSIPPVRDRWRGSALALAPADREMAEHGVRQAYERAGPEGPGAFAWLRSPLEGAVAAQVLRGLADPRGGRRAEIWDGVRDQLGGHPQAGPLLRNRLEAVMAKVGDEVHASVSDQVRRRVWDRVRLRLGGEARAAIWDQIREEEEVQVSDAVYRQHEADWLAYFDALAQLGVSGCDRRDGLTTVARGAGWWWPFPELVLLSERPSRATVDAELRPHADDGPAIAYADGFAVWGVVRLARPPGGRRGPRRAHRRAHRERAGHEHSLRDGRALRSGPLPRRRGRRPCRARRLGRAMGHRPPFGGEARMVETVNAEGRFERLWLWASARATTPREAFSWSVGPELERYGPASQRD